MSQFNESSLPLVVLLDDERADLELNVISIERCGLEVRCETFDSSVRALDFLKWTHEKGRPPSLLVMDLYMRDSDGLEMLEAMDKWKLREFPVVIMSGTCSASDILHAKRLGAEACYEKPMMLDESCALFRSLLQTYVFPETASTS